MEQTSTTTTTDRPASMGDALASVEASSASETATAIQDQSTTTAATAQSGTDTAAAEGTTKEGTDDAGIPMPLHRHKTILENARKEHDALGYKRAKEELEQQYASLKPFVGLGADDVNGLVIWQRALSGDPQALAHIKGNQQVVAQLRQWFAEPPADVEPEADLQTADGTPVYSAAQQAKREAWLTRQIEARLAEKFKPLAKVAQTQEQFEAQQRQQAELDRWAANAIGPIKRLPHYDEFKADIGKALQGAPADASPEALSELVYDTYAKLLDARSKKSVSDEVDKLKQLAVAGSGNVNPGSATTATPKRPRSMAEALAAQG